MKRRHLLKLSGIGAVSAVMSHQLAHYSSNNSILAEETAISVEIDWTNAIAETTPLVFGSNDYEITNPKYARNTEFQSLLERLDIPLIRIHHSELSDRWTDAASRTWDEAKIKAGYDASYPHNPTLVQNIPRPPKWMEKDDTGLLAASEYENYANLCGDLVTILNQKQQRNIQYWEPINELENPYEKRGELDRLWKLYNFCARAMKKRDSRIKIGGPAISWDDRKLLTKFLRNCGSNVDFISWHRYGTGNAQESTDKLMSRTSNYKKQVRKFRSVVSETVGNRKIPLFLSEYNINYSWKSGEMRQNNHIGAVWFASVLKHLAEAEIEMATSWHLKDGVYGMIDPRNNLRPAARVFAWGNRYFVGTVVATESSDSFVEALAVRQTSGERSLLLINKSSNLAPISLQSQPKIFTENTTGFTLGKDGVASLSNPTAMFSNRPLILEPHSLLLLINA